MKPLPQQRREPDLRKTADEPEREGLCGKDQAPSLADCPDGDLSLRLDPNDLEEIEIGGNDLRKSLFSLSPYATWPHQDGNLCNCKCDIPRQEGFLSEHLMGPGRGRLCQLLKMPSCIFYSIRFVEGHLQQVCCDLILASGCVILILTLTVAEENVEIVTGVVISCETEGEMKTSILIETEI